MKGSNMFKLHGTSDCLVQTAAHAHSEIDMHGKALILPAWELFICCP